MKILTILLTLFIFLGCSVSEENPKEFSKEEAISFANIYLTEKGLIWGKPSELISNKLNGKIVQYTLYFKTPTGEKNRLGKRGLIVNQTGQVTKIKRR